MRSHFPKSLFLILSGLLIAAGTAQAEIIPSTDLNTRANFADTIVKMAERLSHSQFVDGSEDLPASFRNLSYDDYRDIRFRPEKTLWQREGIPFTIRFFHRGFYFKKKVAFNVIENGGVKRIHYSKNFFNFGKNTAKCADYGEAESAKPDQGFAGFQIFYPLVEHGEHREVVAFLGASYFRAAGRNQSYGLSARGVAINTGMPFPEEFPYFREFWIEKPEQEAKSITVHALLDGPSLTGAFRFIIYPAHEPNSAVLFDITATLFARKNIARIGLAPLTSMHFQGKCQSRHFDDFRPEVHDSDGLLMDTGENEWLWRPLINPGSVRINTFSDQNPKGFGLFQRERLFDHYQDLEANYHHRPNAWVEAVGHWQRGAVHLVQIPSHTELNDNIVAFWTPENPVQAGDRLQYAYRIRFSLDDPNYPPGSRVLATRTGQGGIYREPSPDDRQIIRQFIIDFSGKSLRDYLRRHPEQPIEAVLSATTGRIRNKVVQENAYTGTWRVSFEFLPIGNTPSELRCFIKSAKDALSETWTFLWTAQ